MRRGFPEPIINLWRVTFSAGEDFKTRESDDGSNLWRWSDLFHSHGDSGDLSYRSINIKQSIHVKRVEQLCICSLLQWSCCSVSPPLFHLPQKTTSNHLLSPYQILLPWNDRVLLPLPHHCSPTLFAALSNLLPVFIFILATIFRLEKLDIRRITSQAKVLGTIVSITGAIMVTLYKGHPLINTPPNSSNHQMLNLSLKSNWVIGGALVTAYCLIRAIWYIFQTKIIKEYPEELILTFFYCLFATLHSAIFTLIKEGSGVWRLRHEIEYVAVVYTGSIGCGFTIVVHAWYLRRKGPIYVSIFKPLGIAIAVIMSVIFLGDTLYLGSVIGSVVISVGFYGVLWGKFKEDQVTKNIGTSSLDHSPRAPLLVSNI